MFGNTISLQLLVSVTALHTFYFSYSMFSIEIDELCVPAYINVRNFYWILLSIQVDAARVDIMDSLDKNPELYKNLHDVLQR
jgi:hypothetical protein